MTTNLVMHLKDNLMDRVLNTVGWWRPLQAQFSGPFWPIFGSYWPSWSFLFGGVKSTPLQTLPKQYLFWATNDLFMINIAVRINAVLIWSATTENNRGDRNVMVMLHGDDVEKNTCNHRLSCHSASAGEFVQKRVFSLFDPETIAMRGSHI